MLNAECLTLMIDRLCFEERHMFCCLRYKLLHMYHVHLLYGESFCLFLFVFLLFVIPFSKVTWEMKYENTRGFKNAIALSTWALYIVHCTTNKGEHLKDASYFMPCIHSYKSKYKFSDMRSKLSCLCFFYENSQRIFVEKELPWISYHLIDSLNSIWYLHPSYKEQLQIIGEKWIGWSQHSQHEWRNTNNNNNNN